MWPPIFNSMTININNISWKIKFIPGSSGDLRRYDGSYTIGMTDNKKKTIFLYEDLHGEMLYKVLCHELVHAYCFSYGIYMDEEDEERLANFIVHYASDILHLTYEVLENIVRKNF